MAAGKWIGGFLGFINGGPLGAIAGFVLGWLFDASVGDGTPLDYNNNEYNETADGFASRRAYEGQRNSFLFSLLVLSAYIIRADGRVMHSEMEVVRRFLRQNFGEQAVNQGEQILLRIFDQQKQMGANAFRDTIRQSCQQIAANMDYSQRLMLVNYLVLIAQADGTVANEEMQALREIAYHLGLSAADIDSMFNLRNGGNDLEAAYKVLGISPDATNDEVKAAFRKLALQHHPDRVASLGDDVRKAAEKKFKEINDAKERIYKARGL
ncbi:MAG: TerB family tellurite resistance protein [Prevotella sp.]|nr:TerB family tellurite resistance protein [Prevotella sp.]